MTLWVTHEFKTFIKNTWLISIICWLIALHWLRRTLAVVCNQRGYCNKKFWCLLIVFVLFCMNRLSFIVLKFRLQAHKNNNSNNNNKINLFCCNAVYSVVEQQHQYIQYINFSHIIIIIKSVLPYNYNKKWRFHEPCSCNVLRISHKNKMAVFIKQSQE